MLPPLETIEDYAAVSFFWSSILKLEMSKLMCLKFTIDFIFLFVVMLIYQTLNSTQNLLFYLPFLLFYPLVTIICLFLPII